MNLSLPPKDLKGEWGGSSKAHAEGAIRGITGVLLTPFPTLSSKSLTVQGVPVKLGIKILVHTKKQGVRIRPWESLKGEHEQEETLPWR